ncbi:MAG: DUF3455 domain-containing protein [Rhizobacter sp.]
MTPFARMMTACVLVASSPLVWAQSVPDTLKPGADEQASLTLAAHGVQIYECRSKDDKAEWVFLAPEAQLYEQGRHVGSHYAGPTWELDDASRVVGTVKARENAPLSGAIPWLLLNTRSVGTTGQLANTSSIQRVNTAGGAAPTSSCATPADLGRVARVPYYTQYVFFKKK